MCFEHRDVRQEFGCCEPTVGIPLCRSPAVVPISNQGGGENGPIVHSSEVNRAVCIRVTSVMLIVFV